MSTTLEINAEIFRSLGVIAEDEKMTRRAAKYLKKLAHQMMSRQADGTLMSKDEYFQMIDSRLEKYKNGETQAHRISSKQELQEFFDSL